jgi:hypothetical protein
MLDTVQKIQQFIVLYTVVGILHKLPFGTVPPLISYFIIICVNVTSLPVFTVLSKLQVLQPKFHTHFSFLSCILYAMLISVSMVLLPLLFSERGGGDYADPDCEIFLHSRLHSLSLSGPHILGSSTRYFQPTLFI